MQYGFRAGQSTLHTVQEVQKRVDKAFSMKQKLGGFCFVVTHDVKKAFNTVKWGEL